MKSAWKNILCMLAGMWLLFSPFILQFKLGSGASGDAIVTGVFIGAVAMLAVAVPRAWEEWVKIALGVWLLISPWLLSFGHQPVARDDIMAIGLLVVVMSSLSLLSRTSGPEPESRVRA